MTVIRIVRLPDLELMEHFGHLAVPPFELHHRVPRREWELQEVAVPIAELHCYYPDPGGGDVLGGLMASVAWAAGSARDKSIVDMVAALRMGLDSGAVETRNPSLARVLAMRDAGREAIRCARQPLAFVELNGRWYVREGTHRTVALALLGESVMIGLNLSSARQVAAQPGLGAAGGFPPG